MSIAKLRAEREALSEQRIALKVRIKALSEQILALERQEQVDKAMAKLGLKPGSVTMTVEPAKLAAKPKK